MSALERMCPIEQRTSVRLASIFGLRLLGMFVILPGFAAYAEHRYRTRY